MSVVEKLEKAIKNLREDIYRDMDARMAYDGLEHTFVAFKKDYASKIHVSRKQLEELIKQRPKYKKGFRCESWALNDVEYWFSKLDKLLGKVEKTK